jgi:hypothetical protein
MESDNDNSSDSSEELVKSKINRPRNKVVPKEKVVSNRQSLRSSTRKNIK